MKDDEMREGMFLWTESLDSIAHSLRAMLKILRDEVERDQPEDEPEGEG